MLFKVPFDVVGTFSVKLSYCPGLTIAFLSAIAHKINHFSLQFLLWYFVIILRVASLARHLLLECGGNFSFFTHCHLVLGGVTICMVPGLFFLNFLIKYSVQSNTLSNNILACD